MTRVNVLVSEAVRDLWTGPARPARVHAVFPQATYLTIDDHRVLAIVTRDGVQQPSAAVVPWTADRAPAVPRARIGAHASIGDGGLRLAGRHFAAVRWWDPWLSLPACPALDLSATARELAAVTPSLPTDLAAAARELQAALARADVAAGEVAARRLLGRGPGLTPLGDDVLAGWFATTATLAPHVACATGAASVLATALVAQRIATAAVGGTTTISAGLLRDAARGALVAPIAHLLRAVMTGTVPGPVIAAVRAIGASSGDGLLVGSVAALGVLGPSVPAPGAAREERWVA